MARRGRSRKAGARHPGGKLVQTPRFDKGCEGVLRRQMFYGKGGDRPDYSQTFDALGRAWSAGLLPEKRGKMLLDGGRQFCANYWRAYGFLTMDSLAKHQPQEARGAADPDRERINAQVVKGQLKELKDYGRGVRQAFDELVIDRHADEGPPWLDRMIFALKDGKSPAEADSDRMRLAVIGLELLFY